MMLKTWVDKAATSAAVAPVEGVVLIGTTLEPVMLSGTPVPLEKLIRKVAEELDTSATDSLLFTKLKEPDRPPVISIVIAVRVPRPVSNLFQKSERAVPVVEPLTLE